MPTSPSPQFDIHSPGRAIVLLITRGVARTDLRTDATALRSVPFGAAKIEKTKVTFLFAKSSLA
jgi:hypothetical protein